MATARLSMRKIREILRLKWGLGRTHREIARSLSISVGVVGSVSVRAQKLGWALQDVEAQTDAELETKMYGPRQVTGTRPEPDCRWIHRELRKTGVTLELLHLEYLQAEPKGLRYTAFCSRYRKWCAVQPRSMRQTHRAGEKMFVDYSGKRPTITNPETGERTPVELFVAVLGASSYTFVEATASQKSEDWIQSHIHALEYFGGVPEVIVCDQLKAGVARADKYEPELNRTYEDLARHYDSIVIPARPYKPKDKAKVESNVLVAQRWILARLRNETFFSLHALNERVRQYLAILNNKRMRAYGQSRQEMFEKYDSPALKPLPGQRYQYADWKRVKVHIDGHVQVEGHYYSVPYPLIGQQLEARIAKTTVELFGKAHKRVASHFRSNKKGQHTTTPEHLPKNHRHHLQWTPARLLSWAGTIGPKTEAMVARILETRKHPEQGYRSCLGILRLAKKYSPERLEKACAQALIVGAQSYRHLANVLKNGFETIELEEPAPQVTIEHENIRGPDYFH